jgi:hypothetical protein
MKFSSKQVCHMLAIPGGDFNPFTVSESIRLCVSNIDFNVRIQTPVIYPHTF